MRQGYEGPTPYHIPGLNRRARKALMKAKRIVLHVFSGRTKPVEFGLSSDVAVLNLDALYGANVLDDRVYAAAAALCGTGKVDAVVGGPPRGTISILREKGGAGIPGGPDGGPRPVRGRTGMLRFGLPTNTAEEQRKVDEHTVLITRFIVLHHVADEANPGGAMCALENPEDPLNYLPESRKHSEIPSLWAWPEVTSLLVDHKMEGPAAMLEIDSVSNSIPVSDSIPGPYWYLAKFDQGVFGHVVRKPTAILTNSWDLYQEINECRGHGLGASVQHNSLNLGERIQTSGYWAKWAPGLCAAVGRAICRWISSPRTEREEEEREGRAMLRALTKREQEFRKHCEEGHIAFRRDCRACLEGQMRSHIHRRQKHHGSNTFCLTMDLVGRGGQRCQS